MNAPFASAYKIDSPNPKKSLFENATSVIRHIFEVDFWRKILICVSFYTTVTGATLLYSTYGGEADGTMRPLAYLIPIALAGMLHVLIFHFLTRFAGRRRLSILAIAMPLQLVAAMLSFGYHWLFMKGGEQTTVSFMTTQQTTIRAMEQSSASFQFMGNKLDQLAIYSAEQAKKERDTGFTCDGVHGAGDGPRRWRRDEDNRIFTETKQNLVSLQGRLTEKVAAANRLAANSASEALAQVSDLRRILNEAKAIETDPAIADAKISLTARRNAGNSPFTTPAAMMKPGVPPTYTCADQTLDRKLAEVVTAIDGLKPTPELTFNDFRDPRVGFQAAWSRLMTSLTPTLGGSFWPSREALRTNRIKELKSDAASASGGGLERGDMPAIMLAVSIEAILTFTFMIRGASIVQHPAIEELVEVMQRSHAGAFQALWNALKSNVAMLRVLDRYVSFQDHGAYVFVPLSDQDEDVQRLKHVMEIAAGVGIARRKATGWWIPRLLAVGWNKGARKRVFANSQVRVYSLSHHELVTILLDSFGNVPPAHSPGDWPRLPPATI